MHHTLKKRNLSEAAVALPPYQNMLSKSFLQWRHIKLAQAHMMVSHIIHIHAHNYDLNGKVIMEVHDNEGESILAGM